jgi:hypothetical protein
MKVPVISAMLIVSTPAFAFYQGNEQQRAACTPDAMRVCFGSVFGGAEAVFNCLRDPANESALSAECHGVMYPASTGRKRGSHKTR